jgi:hypothetical protein
MRKKYEDKNPFFASVKSLKKGSESGFGSGSGSASQRHGSGSALKCHGSPTLPPPPLRVGTNHFSLMHSVVDSDSVALILRLYWILIQEQGHWQKKPDFKPFKKAFVTYLGMFYDLLRILVGSSFSDD